MKLGLILMGLPAAALWGLTLWSFFLIEQEGWALPIIPGTAAVFATWGVVHSYRLENHDPNALRNFHLQGMTQCNKEGDSEGYKVHRDLLRAYLKK